LTELIYQKDTEIKSQIQEMHVDLAKVEHQSQSVVD